ncbi:MAG: ferredoxin-NADP reductase [Gammaproteobacteria bacterium]|nr:ferredoxin-NADP reductase [Gammaproteobacteria bacterium]
MRLEDFDTGTRYQARVLSSQRLTSEDASEEVREIVLEMECDTLAYQPGQSIGVIIEGEHAMGHKHHFRLYSIADTAPPQDGGKPRVTICVKRCDYIDEYSGERCKGIASNYLCDLAPGDSVTITGPFGMPFEVPQDREANLLLIGMGTGIAPFRALVKHIYEGDKGWKGKVHLFYGARTGLELLYMNEQKDDFSQYYDQGTFAAFKALSPRPNWADPIAMDFALEERSEEILEMLEDAHTRVYVAGRADILETLDHVFANMIGSREQWARRKAELKAGQRWVELVY